MDLSRILDSVAKKMRLDFEEVTSEIQHHGLKGRAREAELLEQYLVKYLPPKVEIAAGEIVSAEGGVSNECDIVVHDRAQCPVLLQKSGCKIFPVEAVYGVIEVKSRLDSRELADAHSKLVRIKKMRKSAFAPQAGAVHYSTTLYGKDWDHFPTLGFVFAYDSIDLLTLRRNVDELQATSAPEHRIDSVWILKKGMIVNWNDAGTIEPTASSSTRLRAVAAENPLLAMTVQMQQLFQGAWMPTFRVSDYLRDAAWGEFLEP